jgi:2-polyprenyl-3-methyl-5-hydroxy-6-metoxy-1,4-benzoquinol methylase
MTLNIERVIPDRPECKPMLQVHMARYRFVEPCVQGAMMLDVGCGCGYGTHHLATSGAQRAIGIDISQEAVEYACRHYSAANLDFRRMDATALDFPDETFDVVVCLEVLEHVSNHQRLLAETRRVLRPGGRIVVSTPNGQIFSPNGKPINPKHVREFSKYELEKVLAPYFENLQFWGQMFKTSLALPLTLFHLYVQRYVATHNSRLSRLFRSGYDGVVKAALSLVGLGMNVVKTESHMIAKADNLLNRRTWSFIVIGCRRSGG